MRRTIATWLEGAAIVSAAIAALAAPWLMLAGAVWVIVKVARLAWGG